MNELKRRPATRSNSWAILLLLTVAMGISFVDRGTLSIALGSIKRELRVSEAQLGLLSAAFFMSYTLMQLLVGKLLERASVVWLYASAFLVWSTATVLTGFTRDVHLPGVSIASFQILFLLRLILGCGESISYPATAVLITGLFPESNRGTANSLIDAGSKIGPALGIMLGTSVLAAFGWRAMFICLGLVSLLWLPAWLVTTRSVEMKSSRKEWSPGYREIASKRSFWGAALGHVGGNYGWSLFVAWLPYYFELTGHFTGTQLIWISSMPFWVLSVASLGSGYLSDWLIRRGALPVRVRKVTVCAGCLGCALCLVAAVAAHNLHGAMVAISAASFCLGLFSSNNWALAQTLSGRNAAAKWTSLQNLFANISATMAAWITGVVLARTGKFSLGLLIAAGMLMAGAAAYWFGIDADGKVTWSEPSQERVNPCVPA